MKTNKKKLLLANQQLVIIKNKDDEDKALEQYRLLSESIDYTSEIRESANNFWITVNSLLISGIAYLRGLESINRDQYAFLMWSSLILGTCLCYSWLSSLGNIKKSIDTRNQIMMEIEKFLPVKIFTSTLGQPENVENKSSITIKEMLVPCTFLLGYIFFAILLVWMPSTVLGKS